MNKIDLEFKLRENSEGIPCVAPFINGWNVWDIPESQWTRCVEKAIIHAYELGWSHANKEHSKLENVFFDLDSKFEGVKDERL